MRDWRGPGLGFQQPLGDGPIPAHVLQESQPAGNPAVERRQRNSPALEEQRTGIRALITNDIVLAGERRDAFCVQARLMLPLI